MPACNFVWGGGLEIVTHSCSTSQSKSNNESKVYPSSKVYWQRTVIVESPVTWASVASNRRRLFPWQPHTGRGCVECGHLPRGTMRLPRPETHPAEVCLACLALTHHVVATTVFLDRYLTLGTLLEEAAHKWVRKNNWHSIRKPKNTALNKVGLIRKRITLHCRHLTRLSKLILRYQD